MIPPQGEFATESLTQNYILLFLLHILHIFIFLYIYLSNTEAKFYEPLPVKLNVYDDNFADD